MDVALAKMSASGEALGRAMMQARAAVVDFIITAAVTPASNMSGNYPDGTSQSDFDRHWNELDDERCTHGVSIYEVCLECWPDEQEVEAGI